MVLCQRWICLWTFVPVLLFCVVWCDVVVVCRAVLCGTVPCRVVLCRAMPCRAMCAPTQPQGGYKQLHVHSVTDYPWPYPDEFADIVVCNGVLIYVEDPGCLQEFLRVSKPGGHLYFMIREDGLATYWDTMCALERRGAWSLRHMTEPRENMPKQPQSILYRIYVYQKAVATAGGGGN